MYLFSMIQLSKKNWSRFLMNFWYFVRIKALAISSNFEHTISEWNSQFKITVSAASDGCFSCSQYVKVAITSSIFVMEILGQNHAFYSNWHLEQQSELPAQAAHGLPRHHQERWDDIFLGKLKAQFSISIIQSCNKQYW